MTIQIGELPSPGWNGHYRASVKRMAEGLEAMLGDASLWEGEMLNAAGDDRLELVMHPEQFEI